MSKRKKSSNNNHQLRLHKHLELREVPGHIYLQYNNEIGTINLQTFSAELPPSWRYHITVGDETNTNTLDSSWKQIAPAVAPKTNADTECPLFLRAYLVTDGTTISPAVQIAVETDLEQWHYQNSRGWLKSSRGCNRYLQELNDQLSTKVKWYHYAYRQGLIQQVPVTANPHPQANDPSYQRSVQLDLEQRQLRDAHRRAETRKAIDQLFPTSN